MMMTKKKTYSELRKEMHRSFGALKINYLV